MGIANAYNRVIRNQIKQHAAWLPVSNIFALGDFGVVSGSVFTRIGNIASLGCKWTEKSGPPLTLNFTSASVTATRFEAGAKVDVFSESVAIDAKLELSFKNKNTFALRANQMINREIDDAFAVAAALHRNPSWRPHYRFVMRTYTAEKALILASRENDTQVTLAGKAAALKQLELGNLAVGIEVATNRQLSLECVGESGVVALGLGRVSIGGAIKTLEADEGEVQIGVEEDIDWDSDPIDDV